MHEDHAGEMNGTFEVAKVTTSRDSAWSAMVPVITAVGTGVGLLGFVAFFGGASLWTQADSAHLPASEVVALVPRAVLLSTGAHFLTSAILLALFSVALLWISDEQLRRRSLPDAIRYEEGLARRLTEWRLDDQRAMEDLQRAQNELDVAIQAETAAQELLQSAPDNPTYRAALDETVEARRNREDDAQRAETEVERTRRWLQEEAPQLEQEAATVHAHRTRQELWWRLSLLGVPLFGFELALTTFAALAWYDYLTLIALSAATVAMILVVYAETDNFIWFAVSAFLAIGLYMGFTTYFRTRDTPKAEPAAALVDGRRPIAGYFIAQTSDRIYLGLPGNGSIPAHMISLRRSDVVALAIGQSIAIAHGQALMAADALATSLCSDLTTSMADVQPNLTSATDAVCPRDATSGKS